MSKRAPDLANQGPAYKKICLEKQTEQTCDWISVVPLDMRRLILSSGLDLCCVLCYQATHKGAAADLDTVIEINGKWRVQWSIFELHFKHDFQHPTRDNAPLRCVSVIQRRLAALPNEEAAFLGFWQRAYVQCFTIVRLATRLVMTIVCAGNIRVGDVPNPIRDQLELCVSRGFDSEALFEMTPFTSMRFRSLNGHHVSSFRYRIAQPKRLFVRPDFLIRDKAMGFTMVSDRVTERKRMGISTLRCIDSVFIFEACAVPDDDVTDSNGLVEIAFHAKYIGIDAMMSHFYTSLILSPFNCLYSNDPEKDLTSEELNIANETWFPCINQ
jgi:hypothetical protein